MKICWMAVLGNALTSIEGVVPYQYRGNNTIYVNYHGKKYKFDAKDGVLYSDKIEGSMATSLDDTGKELARRIEKNLIVTLGSMLKGEL